MLTIWISEPDELLLMMIVVKSRLDLEVMLLSNNERGVW